MSDNKDSGSVDKVDFTVQPIHQDSFESYKFTNCQFSDIAGIDFTDCSFIRCNLSNAAVKACKMQDIEFIDCKLLGVNFFETKDFGFSVRFENCVLDYASFDNKKLNKSVFINCRLQYTNFTQADLSKSKLVNCDLSGALFYQTNLTGVDFTSSQNFDIDPTSNRIKKAKFLSADLAGLLTKFDIIIK
jgi:uncharacterized protein YjbI with pentapeptide repeats